MSGIINSAGSKSGVIGTTELDYEEGTFTPTNNGTGWSNSATTSNTYVKIGKSVTCYMYLQLTSGSATNMIVDDLPFTSGSEGYSSSSAINHGTSVTFPCHFRMNGSSDQMNLVRSDSGTAPYADNFNGTHAIFSITYKVA